jgi:hypothetical protein
MWLESPEYAPKMLKVLALAKYSSFEVACARAVAAPVIRAKKAMK